MDTDSISGAYSVVKNDADKKISQIAVFFKENWKQAVIGSAAGAALWALLYFVK
jgi:hypothetical protein